MHAALVVASQKSYRIRVSTVFCLNLKIQYTFLRYTQRYAVANRCTYLLPRRKRNLLAFNVFRIFTLPPLAILDVSLTLVRISRGRSLCFVYLQQNKTKIVLRINAIINTQRYHKINVIRDFTFRFFFSFFFNNQICVLIVIHNAKEIFRNSPNVNDLH